MKNDKPTQEELERFWNWCGFIVTPYEYWDGADKHIYPNDYQYPNKHWGKQPLLTLDNLFKYAVSKIDFFTLRHCICMNLGLFPRPDYAEDWTPAPAHYGSPGTPRWHWYEADILVIDKHIKAQSKDPALALFWAMQEVIENEGHTV